MKAQALEELTARTLQKFGDSAEVREVVQREIASFFAQRPTITLEDLQTFDNRLAATFGFPLCRRSQWAKLSKSSAVSSRRYANLSQDAPSEAPPIRSRLATRSLDLKFPAVSDIIPVTRHWKPAKTVRDNTIFPRFENREAYTPSPDRVNVTDTMRTTFNWKYGDSVERVNKSQAPDEWGDILKWDTTKFLWEQDDQRRTLRQQQQEYRDFLRRQMEDRAQQAEAEKAEQSREKGEVLERVRRERVLESQQVRDHRQRHVQHQQALQVLIADSQQKKVAAKQQKFEEGRRIQQKHDADLAEELQRQQDRRKHNLTLTQHNLKTFAEQQEGEKARRLESHAEDMKRAEAAARHIEAVENKRRQLSLSMAKTVLEDNQQTMLQRAPTPPESVHTAHGELFRKHDFRARQAKLQLLQNVSVLAQQVQEKTLKDDEWRQLGQQQAELWKAEQDRHAQEDAAHVRRRKQHKEATRLDLLQQMDEKRQTKLHSRRLSPAEAKLNRHLLKAACGVDAI